MQAVISFLTPIVLFVSTLSGFGSITHNYSNVTVAETPSVELGLHEVSPLGDRGGFAMPASGCSDLSHGPIHDCAVVPSITTDHPIIRLGDPVTVTWDPHGNTNCVLSANLTSLTPTPNGTVAGSIDDTPTGETTYSIVCDGAGNTASVSIKVLPRIQET